VYDLTVEFDEAVPTNAVYITLGGKELRVIVSPRVEAEVLRAVLHPQVASAVADAVEQK
jgi:hypothetical protein